MTQKIEESVQAQIAEYSRKLHDEYLEDYDFLHNRVAEFPSLLVFEDSYRHEYNQWANVLNVDRETVKEWNYDMARGVDRQWSITDPVVLLRD